MFLLLEKQTRRTPSNDIKQLMRTAKPFVLFGPIVALYLCVPVAFAVLFCCP